MPLTPGTTLAQYEILAPLGAGGMGEVYRARDTRLRRDVAIKVLPDDLPADALERLHREARAASVLAHPNICAVFDLGEAGGRSFLVMELVDGVTLREYAAGKRMDPADIVAIGVQIADALDAAHTKGIVHRDIKPGNIMVGGRRRVKVLDFGLAKQIAADAMDQTRTLEPLTAAGTTIGTPAYMAPEAMQGGSPDVRSDVWSLGVVLYELLAGRRPFEGRTPFELSSRIIHDPPPPLPGEVPAGLRTVVERCLAKRIDDRYQTAAQLRDALEALQTSTMPVAAGPRSPRWSRARVVGAAVALALVAAVMMLRPGREPARKLTSTGAPASPVREANDAFELAMQRQRVQNDFSSAMTALERALAADPHFSEARRNYAFLPVLTLLNGYTNDTTVLYRAEEGLRQAERDDPTLRSLPAAFTAVYLMQGRRELAPIEALDRSIEKDPNNDSLLWRAILYLLEENTAAVKTLAARMLDGAPLFAPARMFLGETLRTEGDYAGAIREHQKVMEQGAGNVSGIYFLTLAYIDAGELDEAERLVESRRAQFAGNYSWRLTRGLLSARQGKRLEALDAADEETLKFAAAAFPQTVSVAELYALAGEESKAIEWLDRAVRNGDERIGWFRRNPRFSTIRNNPRFLAIIDSIEARRIRRPATP